MEHEIIPMREEHIDEALRLWARIPGLGLSKADSRERIREYLARNHGFSFIARSGGAITGTVLCGHDSRRGYIYHLAVDGRRRRRGIGKLLTEKCFEALRKSNIDKCHFMVFGDNHGAREFYTRIGCREREDLVVFSKEL